jgi:tetratricopeptide (TPR) repeat protein
MIAHELGDRRSEGAALVSLGNAYSNLGDVSRAIELFEQQLMIARELGDRRSEGAALGNLGTAYAALNSMNEAKDFLGRSLAIARQFGDRRREGALIYNLSLVLEKQGDGLGAIAEAEIALQIFEELEDSNASIVRDQLTKWRA